MKNDDDSMKTIHLEITEKLAKYLCRIIGEDRTRLYQMPFQDAKARVCSTASGEFTSVEHLEEHTQSMINQIFRKRTENK